MQNDKGSDTCDFRVKTVELVVCCLIWLSADSLQQLIEVLWSHSRVSAIASFFIQSQRSRWDTPTGWKIPGWRSRWHEANISEWVLYSRDFKLPESEFHWSYDSS